MKMKMNTYVVICLSDKSDFYVIRSSKKFQEFVSDWSYSKAQDWGCEQLDVLEKWGFNMVTEFMDEEENSKAGYHLFMDEDGNFHDSFSVYWREDGWHWISKFPGCLPEGKPVGPFNTSELAWKNARDV